MKTRTFTGMDKGLILCVLLVTLSWTFMGTEATTTHMAESTMTSTTMSTTPNSGTTTMAENTATSPAMSTTPNGDMTTTAENTATSPAMSTTPNGDMTTTAENTATSPAISTTPNGDMTTTAENTATSPAMSTTPNGDMTITAENTVTTAATENMSTTGSTQSPAVSPNNTVQTLETDIDRTQCGSEQLCVAEPPKCDPSATVSCFFLGAKRQSGQNFFFELSGESEGYIAATIIDGNTKGDPTYICAKSKGRVQFIGALLKNDVLTRSELSVNSVKGKITGKRIQCSFLATVPDPRTRTTGIRLSVSTGDFNETDESLGAATPVIKTDPVDLGNPNITVTNVISPNTTTPSPTAAGNNLTTAAPSNNATTAAPSNNATTAAPSINATTAAPSINATTAAPSINATTAAPSNNATTAAPSINATPAGPSITIIPQLVAPVSQEECGSTKLCVAEPSECDPSTGDNCFFLSARRQSGQNFDFELSGQTRGYIAAGVSNAASQADSHRAYICVNNNGNIGYLTGTIVNSVLNTTKTLESSNQQGTVNNGKIQCTFTAALPDTTSRASTQYSLSITTGSYNASSGVFGKADFKVLTPLVNISDPTANISNLLANDTSASSAVLVTPTKSFLPALLVTVCMLAFTIM